MTGEKVFPAVDSIREEIIAISDYIHQNPELGHQEEKAVKFLTGKLAAAGFTVETGVGGFPTAFKAVYQGKTAGPTVAFLAEYDALPGIDHGCGHNLIAASTIGAALALRRMMDDLPGTIVVMGTPAEEVPPPVKGKMVENGAFAGVDVSLTFHGSAGTYANAKMLAVNALEVTYTGKTSHAAASPEQGRSALDGALLALHALEMLREHVRQDTRMHYIIADGGEAPNIVPKHTTVRCFLRGLERAYLDQVAERAEKCFRAGALATETEVEIKVVGKWDDYLHVPALNQAMEEYARQAGAVQMVQSPPAGGSSDFGNVSHAMPTSAIFVAFVPPDTAGHSKEWCDAAGGKAGHDAAMVGAKAMAATAYDLLTQPEYFKTVQAEFARAK